MTSKVLHHHPTTNYNYNYTYYVITKTEHAVTSFSLSLVITGNINPVLTNQIAGFCATRMLIYGLRHASILATLCALCDISDGRSARHSL